jgi:hypothetical protein
MNLINRLEDEAALRSEQAGIFSIAAVYPV